MARSWTLPQSLLTRARRLLYDRGVVVLRPEYPVNRAALERTGRYYPVDFDERWVETIERVRAFTQTSPERLAALCSAVEHVVRNRIEGRWWSAACGRAGA
jgi:hypothetical protein